MIPDYLDWMLRALLDTLNRDKQGLTDDEYDLALALGRVIRERMNKPSA